MRAREGHREPLSVRERQLEPERTGDRARVIQREPGGARKVFGKSLSGSFAGFSGLVMAG